MYVPKRDVCEWSSGVKQSTTNYKIYRKQQQSHTVHVWYICLYIYNKTRPNVGKYTIPIDGMGIRVWFKKRTTVKDWIAESFVVFQPPFKASLLGDRLTSHDINMTHVYDDVWDTSWNYLSILSMDRRFCQMIQNETCNSSFMAKQVSLNNNPYDIPSYWWVNKEPYDGLLESSFIYIYI